MIDLHSCEPRTVPSEGYGPAVDGVQEREDGTLWADNGEYSSQVNYCPFCGFRAKVQIQRKP